MATNKIPFPVSKPLTPSGSDFTESWRQFFLALRDIASTSENFDPSELTVRINELFLESQAQVAIPVYKPSVDELVAQVLASMRVPPADVPSDVFTHGIQDAGDLHALASSSTNGFMSASDKAKLDGIGVVPAQALVADVTAANSAADFTVLTETLPANTSRAGMQRRFSMYGLVSNGTTAGTLQLWVKVGTTKVFTHAFTTPTTAATNKGVFVAFEWCFRTIGASGTLQVSGTLFTNDTPAVTLTPDSLVTPATIDTTAAQTFTFGFNWVAANASNSVTAKSASLVGVA